MSVSPWLPTRSDTGQQITPAKAIAFSTVYACVQLLADSVAGLPWCAYLKTPQGRREDESHPWADIIGIEPNPDMDSFTFRQTMMVSTLLTGNGYAQIVEDGPDRGIYFLRPDFVQPIRRENEIVYLYSGSEPRAFIGRQILHIKALGFDGLVGQSPIAIARNAIGVALGMETFGASFFRNGSRPSGILSLPGKLDADAQSRLRQSWESIYSGSENAGRVAVLEQGMQWQPLTIPQDDAQFLETRQFQRVEICSLFRVPPHMVGDQTGSSYSNNEQANTEFVQHTLRSWVTRWEMEAQRKIFRRFPGTYNRMRFDDLLRGDMVQRSQYYDTMKRIGAINANEIRAREDMNHIGPQGDIYTMSQNETPVEQALAAVPEIDRPSLPKPATPAPASVDEKPDDTGPADDVGVEPAYADWTTETLERLLRVEVNAVQRKREGWEPNIARLDEGLRPICRSAGLPLDRAKDVAYEIGRWMRESDPETWLSTLPVRGASELLEVQHAAV